MRILLAPLLFSLISGLCVAEFQRTITLTPHIFEEIEGFPVFLRITDPSIFTKSMPHGEDLAFLDEDKRRLPFEIVSWDPDQNDSEIWIRLPKVHSARGTKLYLRYGAKATLEIPGYRGYRVDDVWHDDFDLVLHANGSDGQNPSSTGTSSGVVKANDGVAGDSFIFDGSESFIELMNLQHVNRWITPVKKLGEYSMRSPQGLANDGKHLYFASHNDPKPADILKISIAHGEHLATFPAVGPIHSAGGDYWPQHRSLVFSTGGNTNAAHLREITITGRPIQDWNLSKVGFRKGALCAWKSDDRWLLFTSHNSNFRITEIQLQSSGTFAVINEWAAPVALGIPQGMDFYDGHVFYYTDGGSSSRSRSPALITKLRLEPNHNEVQFVEQYAILIDNHEAEGLTITDSGAVFVGDAHKARGGVYQVGARMEDFVSTFKDFTVSLWFKQSDVGATAFPTLIAKGSDTGNHNAFILHTMNIGDESLRVKFGMTAPEWFGIVSEPVSRDSWHHAVGVYNHATGVNFYLDGEFVGSRPHSLRHTIVDRDVPVTVGADIESGERVHFFPGLIDEIRFLKSSSSASRIKASYDNIARFDAIVTIGPEQLVGAP